MSIGLLEKPRLGECKVNLWPYQAEAVAACRAAFARGDRSTLLILPTGCHDPKQGIMMFNGDIKTAENIRVDDELMGPDSAPRTVLAIHAGYKPMYRVIPTKGTPFIVTEDHTLSLVRTRESANPKYPCERRNGEIVDVTVKDWLAWPKWRKHIHKLYRAKAFFPLADTPPIDPYFAGILLGDGSLISGKSICVTTADPEIEAACIGFANRYGVGIRKEPLRNGNGCILFFTNGASGPNGNPLINLARTISLYGMECDTKHVPTWFKYARFDERLSLLAGLIDTDGALGNCNNFDFVSKSPRLADDVAFITRSVGLAAYVRPCVKTTQDGVSGTYHRVSISGNTEIIPVRIPRKRPEARTQIKDVLRTGFTIEPVGVGPYNGFTVDGDHRYLMDDFTVTHNCGKTITFGMITRLAIQKGGRVLILAHRSELIQQAASKLDLLGVEAQVEQADSYARSIWEPDCVVATVQTMRGKRLESWPRDYFRLIITDEAHHATADSYTAITRHFSGARHLGVTATADRADEDELSSVFESVAYEYSLWDAMKAEYPGPYLCRLTFTQCDLQIDLRGLRKGKEDYTTADLEARITPMVDAIANAVRQEIGERKTLIFTPDVASTMALATALRSIGLEADCVYGDDPGRDGKIAALRSGELQVLVNCALLTEGFDCPDVAAVVLCRPTKSRPLYAQMVGRGTRIAPGKTDCLIVDFDFLTDKHDLVKPTDLFDGTHSDTEVLDIAMELALKDKQLPLDLAIERGEQIKQERALVRVQARQREVRYRKVSYDPLAMYDTLGLPWRGHKNADAITNKATEGQVKYLKNLGVENAENISRTRAKTLIDYLADRRKRGLATAKQVSWLIAKGVDPGEARTMTIESAKAALDAIFGTKREVGTV